MQGLGNGEIRQALWEKQYWKGADEERDQKLTFDEVEKLCRRLNINSNHEDLLRLFKVRILSRLTIVRLTIICL
jgi:phosphatidylinositol phospholipase C delta